jgi:hypothetical protein
MREILFVAIVFFSVIFIPETIVSQNDNQAYFLLSEGSTIRLGHFNRRQRPLGFTEYKVVEVSENEQGKDVVIRISHFDRLNNPLYDGEISVVLNNGDVVLPGEYLLYSEFLEYSVSTDAETRDRDMIIPGFLGNGMNLTPSFIELEDNHSVVKITDFSRVVNNFETITTAAGEFDACVISSKREVQTDEMEVYTVYTWLSQGIGPVKMRYYDERRKLVKYSELIDYQPGTRM